MDWINFTIMLCMAIPLTIAGAAWAIKWGGILRKIAKQVTPNGGNTNNLGDRVVMVEKTLENQDQTLERHTHELAAQSKSMRRIEAFLKIPTHKQDWPAERDA